MAFISGRPSASTATVLEYWLVQLTAATADGCTTLGSSTLRAARTIADHHSSGRCSAPPPGRKVVEVSSKSLATISPSAETKATLGPDVPRSMARMSFREEGTATVRVGENGSGCGYAPGVRRFGRGVRRELGRSGRRSVRPRRQHNAAPTPRPGPGPSTGGRDGLQCGGTAPARAAAADGIRFAPLGLDAGRARRSRSHGVCTSGPQARLPHRR